MKIPTIRYHVLMPAVTAAMVTGFFSASALATPTLYPQSLNLLSDIKNPTNSNIIADDTDPRTIYVMPPSEGYGYANGLHTQTANLMFCKDLSQLHTHTYQLEEKEQELRLKAADQYDQIQKLETQIAHAKSEAADYATANQLQELVQINSSIDDTNANLQADYAQLETCKTSCEGIAADIKIQQQTLRDLSKAKNAFIAKNLASSRIYAQKQQKVQALVAQRDSISDDYEKLETDLEDTKSKILALYSSYGSMIGARAAFEYDSQWDQNVTALRAQNPNLNFVALNTENARIYPGIVGIDGLPPATDAIAGFEIPGGSSADHGGIAMPAFPSIISGNAILNLIGACPMVYPELFQFAHGADPKNQKFGMLITYQYPVTMQLKLKVTYNMYKMYQLIRSSGSSGGLFSSHSWSSVEERTFFRDAFRVNWTDQDPQNTLTDEQRLAMEREARNDIYSRMLLFAIPEAPDKSRLLDAAAPPEHGSIVLADGLMQACPGNAYCVAGSLILRGLDAIVGSSSATSTYTQIQDLDLTEEWSFNKVVMKPGITSYKLK